MSSPEFVVAFHPETGITNQGETFGEAVANEAATWYCVGES